MKLIFPDGTTYVKELYTPPATNNEPVPLDHEPDGFLVDIENGYQMVRVKDDIHSAKFGYRSRTLDPGISIALTNMTYPFWALINGVVNEFKTICRLDLRPEWKAWFIYLNGRKNFEWMMQPGIGFADTNKKPTSIDHDELKLQSLDWANNLRLVVPNPFISARYTQVQTIPFNKTPLFIDEKWSVDGVEISWKKTPQVMTKQTLGGHVKKDNEWVSYGPVVDKGTVGGAGDVVIPAVTKYPAIHMTEQLHFYKKPPFEAELYRDSLIVDGIVVDRGEGKKVVIDAYKFSGSDTFVRASGLWYKASEMLVRGSIEDKALGGTWLDRRVYMKGLPESPEAPWIGWIRDYTWIETIWNFIKTLINL